MILKDYQNYYTQALFNQDIRSDLFNENISDDNSDSSLKKSFKSFAVEKFELVANSSLRGRTHIFFSSVPKLVKYFLEEDYLYQRSKDYSIKYPDKAISPKNTGMPHFLEYIKYNAINEIKNIPSHFEDSIDYEIETSKLVFYKLPQIINHQFPVLETNIGLLIASENISEIIYNLKNNLGINHIEANPKKCFILKKFKKEINIEPCNWAVFEILSQLNGLKSWQQLTDELISRENSLINKNQELMDWYDYFLEQNIIV